MTEQPYGRRHRRIRAALIAAMQDGDRCFRCGQPMYSWQRLHADHSDPVALGGQDPDVLSHGACNERHGAQLGNALRGRGVQAEKPSRTVRPAILTTSRDW